MILLLANGVMPTTAKFALAQTGTAIKTLLQVKGLVPLKVIEWGISFPATAAAAPPAVELLTTGTVFATVTALAEADVSKFGAAADLAADILTFGTAATGFTSTAEGTITATKQLDGPAQLPPTGYFSKQFALDQEPIIYKGDAGRIRITSAVDYAVYCWMKLKPA